MLLQLKNESDLVHVWAREGRSLLGAKFRVFKWTPDFDLKREPSIVTQWIFLPGLPMHLYRPDCLRIFAILFGRYLGTDHATLKRTRAMGARMCVEVDLLDKVVKGFPIAVSPMKTISQEVRYEKTGYYCKTCGRQGYPEAVCRVGQNVQTLTGKIKKDEPAVKERQEWRKIQKGGSLETEQIEIAGPSGMKQIDGPVMSRLMI